MSASGFLLPVGAAGRIVSPFEKVTRRTSKLEVLGSGARQKRMTRAVTGTKQGVRRAGLGETNRKTSIRGNAGVTFYGGLSLLLLVSFAFIEVTSDLLVVSGLVAKLPFHESFRVRRPKRRHCFRETSLLVQRKFDA